LRGGGVAVHVALQAEHHGGQIEGVGDHADEELLPLQAEISVSAAGEAQHFGLVFDGEDGDFAGAFDFVLPPADEALVMLRVEVLKPERVLHHAVAGETCGEPMGAEELVNGFEGDFEFPETKGGVGARVETYIGELFVGEGDCFFRREVMRVDWT
jgi:hypothetical protein